MTNEITVHIVDTNVDPCEHTHTEQTKVGVGEDRAFSRILCGRMTDPKLLSA
ncbi:hypothetical protein [Zooshikella harenae]|uniref:Uncharacterized protein n=1 Tax=Zooshikella harenae TaxID=2827238 RepID=A0ABS5ZJA1_9GAMM|nr:hypothetical protein [Zooshikella harenae]MBU2714025.1 hypothetical protein [Zooshikella harenae]